MAVLVLPSFQDLKSSFCGIQWSVGSCSDLRRTCDNVLKLRMFYNNPVCLFELLSVLTPWRC